MIASAANEEAAEKWSRRGMQIVPATAEEATDSPAHSPDSMRERVEVLRQRRSGLKEGETLATARHRARGKLTVRERIDLLLDPGTFVELEPMRRHRAAGFGLEQNRPDSDGVVTGWGAVHGQRIFVYAQDFRLFGGSLGEAHAEKIHKIIDLAVSVGAPLISLNDGGGARIQEGVTALAGYGGIFRRTVAASGVIPQISVMLGPCAGGAAYTPALTDFVFMVRGLATMFLTGPDVVAEVTGESLSADELGGAAVHQQTTGLATFVHDDEETCLEDVRYLVSMLPANQAEHPRWYKPSDRPQRRVDNLLNIVPVDPRQPYDIHRVIGEIVDDAEMLLVHENWAQNIVCAFARLDGHVVGVVGNQPLVTAGALDSRASEKAARFVRTCDAYNIPLVSMVDVPGFLPGRQQEHGGVIRHGAKLLYAYCAATVPRIQLILRKAYGGAYIVMDSRSVGADLSFAWPTNEIAVMGAEAATSIIHRRRLAVDADPTALRDQLSREYRAELMEPFHAAERGLVDDVIDPGDTRRILIEALAMLRGKNRGEPIHHRGNPPL